MRPAGARGHSHPLRLGRREIQGMLWPLSFHLWEHQSATPICSDGICSPSTRCRKLGLMLTLILETWLHGEEVPTTLPWLIPVEASHCCGRCAERERSGECAWSQVHTTADSLLGHLGVGHSQCWAGISWSSGAWCDQRAGMTHMTSKVCPVPVGTQTLPMVLPQGIPQWKTTEALERGVGRGLTLGWVVPAVSDLC